MLKLAVCDGGASGDNVKAFSGAMVDYDGTGGITTNEAAERLRKAGVAALLYTSPPPTAPGNPLAGVLWHPIVGR